MPFKTLFKVSLLSISFGFLTGIASCQKIPPLKATLYQGSSQDLEVVGKEKDIHCSSPEFDTMICMTLYDFSEEYALRFKCEKWKAGTELIDVPEIPEIPFSPEPHEFR